MSEQVILSLTETVKQLQGEISQLRQQVEAKRTGKMLCLRCQTSYNKRFQRGSCPHLPIQHRRKWAFKKDGSQVRAMVGLSKEDSLRNYLIFELLAIKGLRIGSIVGSANRRWDQIQRKWFPCEPNCKGLMVEDLRDNGIYVHAKGASAGRTDEKFFQLPPELVQKIKQFVGKKETGKIFDVSQSRVLQITKQYAKKIGVADWRLVKNHTFRHFVTTNVIKKEGLARARDFVGHKDGKTTMGYADASEPEELEETTRRMNSEVSV